MSIVLPNYILNLHKIINFNGDKEVKLKDCSLAHYCRQFS